MVLMPLSKVNLDQDLSSHFIGLPSALVSLSRIRPDFRKINALERFGAFGLQT
ncbi:hypothetical protein MNBD_GAMMA21-574 [hydrothermal vent metagenome]|uniref:Uncharacterized protein n=1 Tax=hydrothermal vent metagenome TaxID=652676 RepID=A0A3B0ZU18_9ZZZZ